MPYRSPEKIDTRLRDVLEQARDSYPLKVEFTSGYREGDRRQHGKGNAIDVQIYDTSGRAIPDYQDPSAFRAYEQFAQHVRSIQQEMYPNLSGALRWGGYFGGTLGKTYGAMDLMHFDLGGLAGLGMAAGSWANGLSPKYQKAWSIPAATGTNSASSVQPTGIIGKGSPRQDVEGLQAALMASGFSVGSTGADGIYGKNTTAAVRAFQEARGLSIDGKAGSQTLGALQKEVSAKLGGPSAVGQVFGERPPAQAAGPAFTGNLPRPRPSISPLSPGSTDYVPPASRAAPPTLAGNDPRAGIAVNPLASGGFRTRDDVEAAIRSGIFRPASGNSSPAIFAHPADAGSYHSIPSTAAQPPARSTSYTPFSANSPASTNYTGAPSISDMARGGAKPSAWGAGSNVAASPFDRAAISINTPQPQSSDLTKTRLAAIERQRQMAPAYQSPPPSVGAGFTTPFGVKSPEAFASSRPPPQSGFDAIMDLLGGSKAQAAPRAQPLNFMPSPAPAPMWDGGFVEQPGAVTGPVNQAPSLVRTQIEKAARSGILGGRVDHALSISGGNPQAAWDALGPNATQNEIAQMSQRLGSMPRAPTITGGGSPAPAPPSLQATAPYASRNPGSPIYNPVGSTTFKPTPVKTQSFPGLQQQAPWTLGLQSGAFGASSPLPSGEFDPRFAVGGAPSISMGQQPFDIAQQKIGQLKSAQPPAPPQVNQQKGAPTTASRAAGPIGFSPQIAAMQKSLRDAGVTDYQGNNLVVDGLMGARTMSAMQKAGISPIGGGSTLASQGVRSGAPSISGGASSSGSSSSGSRGVNTSPSAGPGNTDAFGNAYGTSSYGTGPGRRF